MERVPVQAVCCADCGFKVSISENYCWYCCKLNPPLDVALDPPRVPDELKQ